MEIKERALEISYSGGLGKDNIPNKAHELMVKNGYKPLRAKIRHWFGEEPGGSALYIFKINENTPKKEKLE